MMPVDTKRSQGLVVTVTSFDVLVALAMLARLVLIVLAVQRW